MKKIVCLTKMLFLIALLSALGCEPTETTPQTKPYTATSKHFSYDSAKIDVLPLTGFTFDKTEDKNLLKVYISLLDQFNSQIKSPGTFRFELYEKLKRTADPKGKRLAIWPDVELTDPVVNNNYWNDFLRTYEFDLEFEPAEDRTYILHATCICPDGRRLSVDLPIYNPQ